MRGVIRLVARRPFLVVLALVLVPGVILSYVGLSGLAEREDAMRASYASTVALVRDRLADQITRLESALPSPKNQAELTDLKTNNAWLDRPFVVNSRGCVMTSTLSFGCTTVVDPLSGLPRVAGHVADAESEEFERGNLNAALRHYREALALVPSSAPSARLLLLSRIGRTLSKLKRPAEATSTYQSLIGAADNVLDRNGLPYALGGLVQLVDLGGTAEAQSAAERQLFQFILDRPWDLDNGYREYLARVRIAADDPLAKRLDAIHTAVFDIDWIRDSVAKWASAQSVSAGLPAGVPTHLATERSGRPVLLGVRRIVDAPDANILGYEIRSESLAGLMMADAARAVSRGSKFRLGFVLPLQQTSPPLSQSPLLPGVPGWNVALFHVDGRSVAQLVRRERWTYGALVVGMISVMAVGIVVALRLSAREVELGRLQTEFVSNVSHELKTPLALIRMFGETLESGLVDDSATRQEFYGVIRRESERLTQLLDNVLDAGRIDRGIKSYPLEQHDLVALVREAVAAYVPLFRRLEFRVETDLSPVPVHVSIDREAIMQALVNVFQNVIKYSGEERFVRVFVGIRSGEACVSVTDHGIGIRREDIPRIFDRYYRVAGGPSVSVAGSGLGLAIVKHAMDAHHGRVDVESTVGQGSVFTLVFPCAPDRAAQTDERGEHQRASA
jgi:signal transduction histidine kinase